MTPSEVETVLGNSLSDYGRAIYLACRGQAVTWARIRSSTALSNTQIARGWRNLLEVHLGYGDITEGREGLVLEEPDRVDCSVANSLAVHLRELVPGHETLLYGRDRLVLVHRFTTKLKELCTVQLRDDLLWVRVSASTRGPGIMSQLRLSDPDSIAELERLWAGTAAGCRYCAESGVSW